MVKHIVMWNIQKDLDKVDVIKKLKEKLEGLNAKVDCLIKLELGENYKKTDTGRDVVLYSEFANKEDFAAYVIHPDHVEVGAYVRSVVCDRIDVDYEI